MTIDQALWIALEHHRAGRLSDAERTYRQIIAQQPAHGPALHMLGVLCRQTGRATEAVILIQQAIKVLLPAAETYVNLGGALLDQKNFEAARVAFAKAVELRSDLAEAHCGLGTAHLKAGHFAEAVRACERAIELKRGYGEALANLVAALRASGLSLLAKGKITEAVVALESAARIEPKNVELLNDRAMALRRAQRLDEARDALSKALEFSPNNAPVLVNLGNIWKDKGDIDRALDCFRAAVAADPQLELAQSNICYAIHFDPKATPATILAEHRLWAQRFASPVPSLLAKQSSGRLKIGYVSPDLRLHPVGRFLLPLLQHHDKKRVEISCYSDVARPDSMTAQLKSCCDAWRETRGQNDESLAELVRSDGIDILVDLTLHMEGSRLLMFARKPSPVQVSWLGYPGTTGLPAVDYRLSDPIIDPPGAGDQNYVEKTFRIPSYWCFAPIEPCPEVNALPALDNGHITFGSLNDFAKVNHETVALWARILQQTEHSEMVIHALPGDHRERVREEFGRAGVDPSRISFVARLPMAEYLGQYQRIDIALDTMPYGGGTTTCDALWMGVPVVTVAGQTAVGRCSASLLTQLGMQSLIGKAPDEYIRIALGLATNIRELIEIRRGLRKRMLESPLMDAARFAKTIEDGFIEMRGKTSAG